MVALGASKDQLKEEGNNPSDACRWVDPLHGYLKDRDEKKNISSMDRIVGLNLVIHSCKREKWPQLVIQLDS